MTVRAICLDLDQTLIDDDTARDLSIKRVASGLAATHRGYGFEDLFNVYKSATAELWPSIASDFQSGAMTSDEKRLLDWRVTLSQMGCRDEAVLSEAVDAYIRHRSEIYILFDDVMPFLTALPADLPRAIVTNGSAATQWHKLRGSGLALHVRNVLISGELGFAKPDPRIFLRACEIMGVSESEAVHVGDSVTNDVGGARDAGLTAVWLNRLVATREPEHPVPHHEIASLSELIALLEQT